MSGDHIDQAAQVLLDANSSRIARYPMVEPITVQAAHEYAEALHEAGLLSPRTPPQRPVEGHKAMTWTCQGCGHTSPTQYRWDHTCPVIYRVYSPTRDMAMYVTDNYGHAKGRASALNQACTTDTSRPDWLVQHATPQWENP